MGLFFSTIVLDYSSPKMDKCYPKLEKKSYCSPKMDKYYPKLEKTSQYFSKNGEILSKTGENITTFLHNWRIIIQKWIKDITITLFLLNFGETLIC